MSKKIHFVLGIHNHQPIGNFDHVFEEAYQKSYLPFAQLLLKHPKIKWSLHCTGILWEWIEIHHKEYFDLIKEMVERKQVELLSGGFYEPILSIIPDEDKIGQIKKLSQYLKIHFNVNPKGMWCAERIWEPHLPKPIQEAGIEYTVLDDTHFISAGLIQSQLYGYYRSEEQYSAVDIFPISKELRYRIPFSPPEKSMEYFRQIFESHCESYPPVLVMADDGEKFGLWPKTFEHVYQDLWLEKFLCLIEENLEWIEPTTFSEYRNIQSPLGKVSLPTASYFEMSEWSLPKESILDFEKVQKQLNHWEHGSNVQRFLKGGTWRNFLSKYPESNLIYKKMLRVSQKVHNALKFFKNNKKIKNSAHEYEKSLLKALNHVWAGQCNCAYWHGVFGGLYLPMLRQALYRNLLEAENILNEVLISFQSHFPEENSPWTPFSFENTDYDGDGKEELLIETPSQNMYLSPSIGGRIFEWDFKPSCVNLNNGLTRRWESYHEKIKGAVNHHQPSSSNPPILHEQIHLKEPGLENILNYDWYLRSSAIDHFFQEGTRLEDFKKCKYGEQGDFVLGEYQKVDLSKDSIYRIQLKRKGQVWHQDQSYPLSVQKTISIPHQNKNLNQSELTIHYEITNLSKTKIDSILFGSEFNFAFSVYHLEKDISFTQFKNWHRTDPYLFLNLDVEFTQPMDGWVFPLDTVSNSETGFEKTFQGLVWMPYLKIKLNSHESCQFSIRFNISKNN